MTDNIKSIYLGNLTAKRGPDGFMYVKGLATDDTLDLDQQICDPAWLAKAMPAWMQIGNIREMHGSKAVGKATEMEKTGTGFVVTAKVVDPMAATMVDEGIYTGFSVGIKGARVVKDERAPGGRIVDGTIVEVSLVDRPANPSCSIEIAKSVDGVLVKGSAVTEIEKAESPALNAEAVMTEEPGTRDEVLDRDSPFFCRACSGTGKKSNVEGNTQETDCDVCGGTGEQPEGRSEFAEPNRQSIPEELDNRDMKAVEPEVEKKDYTDAEREQLAESGEAMPGGGFPIKTLKDLRNAIQSIGRAKDPKAAKEHIIARAKAMGKEELVPSAWRGSDIGATKAAEGQTHDAAELSAIRQGLINTIKAELDEMLDGDDNEICDVRELLCTLEMFLCWWTDEASENQVEAPFTGWDNSDDYQGDTMAYVGLGVSADLIKNASAETATPEVKDELRSEIVKALGLEEVISAKAELSKATEEIELLKAALDEVKSMAAPGGPALRATREQTSKSAAVLAREVEAQRYRNLAAQITDPALRNQYLETARALEASL